MNMHPVSKNVIKASMPGANLEKERGWLGSSLNLNTLLEWMNEFRDGEVLGDMWSDERSL